jgi:hypothetical protein
MNTIQTIFNALAEESALAAELSIQEGQSPVPISQPIDVGADKLLRDYKNAWLTYPPLEVEYLVQTLNEHLNNCIEIRLKAQDLEIKAFSEASDQLLQRRLVDTLKNQIKLFADNEPKLLGNTINAKYQPASGAVTGDTAQDYWKSLLKEQETQLKYKSEDADSRLTRLNETGSGNNYVSRFEFLKKLFETDLIEAYCRARAASVGLKAIYEIDTPVPDIADIGYLDKLILWARGITYDLEKKLFNVRETTVAIALNDSSTGAVATAPPVYDLPRIMTLDAFRLTRTNGGAFIFSIPDDFFKRPNLKLKNPRLKGIDVSVIAAETKLPLQFWRILVKPPVKKINIATGVLPYSHEPTVFVPMATYLAHTADLSIVPNQREVNNVNPVGEWTIRIEPKSILGSADTNNDYVDNLLIRMRIAYDKD